MPGKQCIHPPLVVNALALPFRRDLLVETPVPVATLGGQSADLAGLWMRVATPSRVVLGA